MPEGDHALARETASEVLRCATGDIEDACRRLFPIALVTASALFGLMVLLRGDSESIRWNDYAFGSGVIGALSALVLSRSKLIPRRAPVVSSVLATLDLAFGAGFLERPGEASQYWVGFGLSVLFVTALAAPLVFLLLSWRLPRWLRAFVTVASIAIVLSDVTSLLRNASYIQDGNNNSYVINELLAPAAGKVPASNFIPQYSHLAGWIYVPIAHLVSLPTLVQTVIVGTSATSVIALLAGAYLAYGALARRSFALSALFIASITCVTIRHGIEEGSIGNLMQELPIRIMPGLILAAVFVKHLADAYRREVRHWRWLAIGMWGGLVAWNSQDFGLAAMLVLAWAAIVGVPASRRSMVWPGLFAGLLLGLAIYPVACAAGGSPVNVSYIAYFDRVFQSGFGAALIQVPGPAILVLPFIAAGAVTGNLVLIQLARRPDIADLPRNVVWSAATTAFCALWALIGSLYYVNRAYASGQLQVLLILFGLSAVGLAGLAMANASLRDGVDVKGALRLSASHAPIAFAVALSIGAVAQIPNPAREIQQLFNTSNAGYPTQSTISTVADVRAAQRWIRDHHPHEALAYLGDASNYVHLATGVQTVAIFNDPSDISHTTITGATACASLPAAHWKWLVVSDELYADWGAGLCGGHLYHFVNVQGVRANRLAERG